jgi:hypothetical protein
MSQNEHSAALEIQKSTHNAPFRSEFTPDPLRIPVQCVLAVLLGRRYPARIYVRGARRRRLTEYIQKKETDERIQSR